MAENESQAQNTPIDAVSLARRIAANDISLDEATAISLLPTVQSGYDSKAITEQEFINCQLALFCKISPSAATAAPAIPQSSSGKLHMLYTKKSDLVRILDSLADAVSSGKISEAAFERLHVTDNEKLSVIQAQIDAESGAGRVNSQPVQRREVMPSAIILSTSAKAELPARAAQIKQELSKAEATTAQPFVDNAWVSKYEKSMSALESSEKQIRGESAQFKSTIDALYSKLSNLESQVSNLQTETGYIGGDISRIKAVPSTPSETAQFDTKLNALSNEMEGRVLELSSRVANAEAQLASRMAEIRGLIAKADQFRQAIDLSVESAKKTEQMQKQVDRAERVAELMGKTFVSSTKKFNELEEFREKQGDFIARLDVLSARLDALEASKLSTLQQPALEQKAPLPAQPQQAQQPMQASTAQLQPVQQSQSSQQESQQPMQASSTQQAQQPQTSQQQEPQPPQQAV
ncbi:MAG: hypothetical protein WC408_00740 [Candidatus Micrarchaeia archaeon]|jgi:hypothetical protein